RLGVVLGELPDGAIISGIWERLAGGKSVESHSDHRIAMSLSVAGLVSREPVKVLGCGNINTSFPGYAELMASLGADIEWGG
ncbi:MAG: 3-phosphoshikimate 1-carboxyvinyltransferase, partial [Magnetococcales bacterium]|nr:3-phosphoshikimate 1-carboxyvinyltransferase [Magnetococcales bacterium]